MSGVWHGSNALDLTLSFTGAMGGTPRGGYRYFPAATIGRLPSSKSIPRFFTGSPCRARS
jgi:hypothetical protein